MVSTFVGQVVLDPVILLSKAPKCWDYRHHVSEFYIRKANWGRGVLFPGKFSRIYFKINKTMGWGYGYGKHIAHLNLWDSSLRTQKIKWRLYYCTWCKQIITWMERYPSIQEPHHTTNLIEEIFLRGKSGGWLPLLGQGDAGELTEEGGLHGVSGGVGLKLFRVRSSGISSPELVDFILEGRAGSSFRRVECSMGGIRQLEDLRGKPWAHCASRGLHLELG